ncbi:MAG TPA: hypothetical protein VGI61_09585 [Parafilimonas sp.]
MPYKKEELNFLPEKLISIHELIIYLTKLNNSVMVYVKRIYINEEDNDKIYEMSNGISYKNSDGNWIIL